MGYKIPEWFQEWLYKIPEWFHDWLLNDYAHLQDDVSLIKRDVKWIKWLMGFLLAAVIGAAIAILITG